MYSRAFWKGRWHDIVECQRCLTTWEVKLERPLSHEACWNCGAGLDEAVDLTVLCGHERTSRRRAQPIIECLICGAKLPLSEYQDPKVSAG